MTAAVRAAKTGDPEGMHLLYVRFADEVYASIRNVTGGDVRAEDVTARVFERLRTEIAKFDARDGSFGVWLDRFARTVALDRLGGAGPAATGQMWS